ncbi:hypothetical protein RXV95_04585 [Novosphingobium sp. ZN18A2]|uniref:hypothetical protein n=1 Tax=Novosphingobium sp. ZN18A2 TaxID=3079861 RepID=UPI0030CE4548
MRRILPVLVPLVLLSACAGAQGGYPSLATRPAERAYAAALPVAPEPAATATPVPPDATLLRKLALLRGNAAEAHQRFLDRKAAADRFTASGRGAGTGTEAWSVALLSLASLESARNDTSVILADLDAMMLAANLASAGQSSTDLSAIRAAHVDVSVLVRQESETINAYAARLAG